MHRGSCLCGAVTFRVEGAVPAPDACHCTACRKWSGHFFASADVRRDQLAVHGKEHVQWFESSAKVRRGFCRICGSSLFFDPLDRKRHDWVGVSMGAIDGHTRTQLRIHIFVDDKGDYYDITDGLPQNPQ